AFARVGAQLPGDFTICKAKLRGIESHGMLCSARELTIGAEDDGIMELALELPAGADLRTALALDDVVFEVNLTPNRGDCLSIRGLAREVAVLNGLSVSPPPVAPVAAGIADRFSVAVQDRAGCPRYLGRVLRGVDLSRPSPKWLCDKLERSGVRSIDAVVDVTNYVLLELGQPMHAFDLAQLVGGIEVRRATAGEALRLLDGRDVTLDAATLIIADQRGPVAIAGVMGGDRSGVSAATQDIFLECAFFAPLALAGTARRYGLHTEASHRYERGVDFELQQVAMERATALLMQIVGGTPGPVVETVDSDALPTRQPVRLRQRRLNALVGAAIPTDEVDAAFRRLDFGLIERETSEADGIVWTIRPPSHRFDIEREADLVEEVCRIYGYNRIPARRPVAGLPLAVVPIRQSAEHDLRRFLAGLGMQEAVTFSFIDPALQSLLDPGVEALALANPMSSEQSVMRTRLLPGLVDALRHNVSRQQSRVRLFECGLVFVPGETLTQAPTVAAVLSGSRDPENWANTPGEVDFFDAKGLVERVIEWSGLDDVTFEQGSDPVLHPGQSADVVRAGRCIGRVGRLHPAVESALDLVKPAYVFELTLTDALTRGERRHFGVSRFPAVRRDLALVVRRELAAARVAETVRSVLGDLLTDLQIFDVYQGKGVDESEKSLGLGLTLQDPSATLTDERIAHSTAAVLAKLAEVHGARLR
ncbi:MAG: phenylalanine--tRNA ligase subunit beta, partial [Pseudomonadales bacterium]